MEQEPIKDDFDNDGPAVSDSDEPRDDAEAFESGRSLDGPAAVTGHSTNDTEFAAFMREFDETPAEAPAPPVDVVDPYTAAPPPHFLGDDPAGTIGQDVYRKNDPFAPEPITSDPFVPLPYAPVSSGEAIRRSGLAWSAGVAFFGSVAFTLFLGWLADLLLGTSPWGIVGGIVLGSIIGFLQFFRITSQIFPGKGDAPAVSPLMPRQDDDNV